MTSQQPSTSASTTEPAGEPAPTPTGWRRFVLPLACLVAAGTVSTVPCFGVLVALAMAAVAVVGLVGRLPIALSRRILWALAVTSALTLVMSASHCGDGERAATLETSTVPMSGPMPSGQAAPTQAPARARPEPTPVPLPPLADRASEAPALEARLADDAAFVALRPNSGAQSTRTFLTALSFLLAQSTAPNPVMRALERTRLKDAAAVAVGFAYRTGSLPVSVDRLARTFIASVQSSPNRGLWSTDEPSFDVTALAAFLQPTDAGVLRELIAARTTGPNRWYPYAARRDMRQPWISWLAQPRAALARLRELDTATDEDVRRTCEALGLEVVEGVDPESGELRPACGCSEGAPFTYEGNGDVYPFAVPGGCLVARGTARACQVTFRTGGREYRVNGAADALRPRPLDPDPIWAASADPATMGPKVSIGNAINGGLRMCAAD